MLVYDMVEDTNGISWPTAQWGLCPVRHPQGTSIKGSSGCVGGIWLFDIISDMASSQEFVEGRMNCHMGMYQNQSCYIWGDEHPFTSYLGFTRVPRFWLIPIFWYHSIIVFYHYMLFELGVVLFWFHPFPNIFGIYCRCRLQKNLGVTRQGKRDLFFHV